jgi:hypothetical protein
MGCAKVGTGWDDWGEGVNIKGRVFLNVCGKLRIL